MNISVTLSGIMVGASDLNDPEIATFNQKADSSSIYRLASVKSPDISFDELVRGDYSFGYLLEQQGVESIPSPSNTGPGTRKYLAGKYSYTTNAYRDRIDVIQIEVPISHRNSNSAREDFAQKLASAAAAFYRMHYGKMLMHSFDMNR